MDCVSTVGSIIGIVEANSVFITDAVAEVTTDGVVVHVVDIIRVSYVYV